MLARQPRPDALGRALAVVGPGRVLEPLMSVSNVNRGRTGRREGSRRARQGTTLSACSGCHEPARRGSADRSPGVYRRRGRAGGLQERPFVFSLANVRTENPVSTTLIRVDYDLGGGERFFQQDRGDHPEQQIALHATHGRFTLVGRTNLVSTGGTIESAVSGEVIVALRRAERFGASLAAGGGVLREIGGVNVLTARVIAGRETETWRLHGNVIFQKPLDPGPRYGRSDHERRLGKTRDGSARARGRSDRRGSRGILGSGGGRRRRPPARRPFRPRRTGETALAAAPRRRAGAARTRHRTDERCHARAAPIRPPFRLRGQGGPRDSGAIGPLTVPPIRAASRLPSAAARGARAPADRRASACASGSLPRATAHGRWPRRTR